MGDKVTSFSGWLDARQNAGFRGLHDYAAAQDWQLVDRLEDAWQRLDDDPALSDPERLKLQHLAALAFVRFERDRPRPNRLLGISAFGLGVFMFMAAILSILWLAMFEPLFSRNAASAPPLLTRLADADAARGLITFVFAIGVIALALIIVTAIVTSDDDDGKRFDRSKEILTTLIAILGTILGFYFGKADIGPPPDTPPPVEQQVEAAAPG